MWGAGAHRGTWTTVHKQAYTYGQCSPDCPPSDCPKSPLRPCLSPVPAMLLVQHWLGFGRRLASCTNSIRPSVQARPGTEGPGHGQQLAFDAGDGAHWQAVSGEGGGDSGKCTFPFVGWNFETPRCVSMIMPRYLMRCETSPNMDPSVQHAVKLRREAR